MRRLIPSLALAALWVVISFGADRREDALAAGNDEAPPTTTTTVLPDPLVGASVTTLVPGSPGGGANPGSGGGPTTTVPTCYYENSGTSQPAVDSSNEVLLQTSLAGIPTAAPGAVVTVSVVFFVHNGILHKFDVTSGSFLKRQYRVCPSGAPVTGSPTRWVAVAVTPDPVAELSDKVLSATSTKALVPLPSAVNPPERAAANLGLWLAVDPARATATVRAELGPSVWMETTAGLVSTRWDMGNGDVVLCEGGGVPIPDSALNEAGESPTCGYTYTSVEDLGALAITVTGVYEVSWVASDGRTGTFADITTNPNRIPYEMYEIQTVGGSTG